MQPRHPDHVYYNVYTYTYLCTKTVVCHVVAPIYHISRTPGGFPIDSRPFSVYIYIYKRNARVISVIEFRLNVFIGRDFEKRFINVDKDISPPKFNVSEKKAIDRI